MLLHGLTATRRYVLHGSRPARARGLRADRLRRARPRRVRPAPRPGPTSTRDLVADLARCSTRASSSAAVLVGQLDGRRHGDARSRSRSPSGCGARPDHARLRRQRRRGRCRARRLGPAGGRARARRRRRLPGRVRAADDAALARDGAEVHAPAARAPPRPRGGGATRCAWCRARRAFDGLEPLGIEVPALVVGQPRRVRPRAPAGGRRGLRRAAAARASSWSRTRASRRSPGRARSSRGRSRASSTRASQA